MLGKCLLVAVSETSEFLLSSGIPDVESDWAVVGVEDHWVNLDSESSDVLLFELSSQMSLDESGLSDSTISNENELVLSNNLSLG